MTKVKRNGRYFLRNQNILPEMVVTPKGTDYIRDEVGNPAVTVGALGDINRNIPIYVNNRYFKNNQYANNGANRLGPNLSLQMGPGHIPTVDDVKGVGSMLEDFAPIIADMIPIVGGVNRLLRGEYGKAAIDFGTDLLGPVKYLRGALKLRKLLQHPTLVKNFKYIGKHPMRASRSIEHNIERKTLDMYKGAEQEGLQKGIDILQHDMSVIDNLTNKIPDVIGYKFFTPYMTESPFIYKQLKHDFSNEYKNGGTIHINPANRGKFNATKRRTGKTTEELTHSKNPKTRKRAIFAQNAAKWRKRG